MAAPELENLSQYHDLLKSAPNVIILAHANYSAHSRQLKIEFQDIADKHTKADQIAFGFFDSFEADDINAELRVRSFPAYFIFKHGALSKSVQSANATKAELEKDVGEAGEAE